MLKLLGLFNANLIGYSMRLETEFVSEGVRILTSVASVPKTLREQISVSCETCNRIWESENALVNSLLSHIPVSPRAVGSVEMFSELVTRVVIFQLFRL